MNTIIERHRVKARKVHICDFCGKTIQIGEEYIVATYTDDRIYDWHSCDRCEPYVNEAFNNKNYDWSEGMSQRDFEEYMWEEHRDIATKWWIIS